MVEDPEKFYSRHPEKMDESYSDENLPQEFLELREDFLKTVGDGEILDCGCGTGRDTDYFVRNGMEAVGIDIAEGMIEHAQENREGEFMEKDIRELDFDEDRFEGIWCSASIFFMPKKEMKEALKNLRKVLKPNGIIYISFKIGDGKVEREKWGDSVIQYHLPEDEAVEVLNDSGFEIERSEIQNPEHATFANFFCRSR